MAREIEEYTFPKFAINSRAKCRSHKRFSIWTSSRQVMEEARSQMAHVDRLGRTKVGSPQFQRYTLRKSAFHRVIFIRCREFEKFAINSRAKCKSHKGFSFRTSVLSSSPIARSQMTHIDKFRPSVPVMFQLVLMALYNPTGKESQFRNRGIIAEETIYINKRVVGAKWLAK